MNSLLDLSRLVQVVAPPILVLVCDRFFTAPLRALSPTGLSAATESSSYVGVVIDHWNDGNLPAGLVLNGDAARVVHAGADAISLAVVLALARASSSSRQSNPDGSFNAVPSGRQPSTLQLDELLKPLLAAWNEQRSTLRSPK